MIAFPLTIVQLPTIALLNNSTESYELLELQKGELESYVIIDKDDYVFFYIDEHYQEETVSIKLKSDKKFSMNVDEYRGRLLVEKEE